MLSHPKLDGNGVKAMPGQLQHTILVHSTIEKKEKYRWPNGAHQKNIFE